jgi:formylglycine-generating enzyme required for sulfatase activity
VVAHEGIAEAAEVDPQVRELVGEQRTRVGAYQPNKLGLCDMHGNAWQWCADLNSSMGSDRVVRGGGWNRVGSDCRAAFRGGFAPTARYDNLGFRLARVPVR